eukprot:5642891-Pleurochrysis_carterae.AAC.1
MLGNEANGRESDRPWAEGYGCERIGRQEGDGKNRGAIGEEEGRPKGGAKASKRVGQRGSEWRWARGAGRRGAVSEGARSAGRGAREARRRAFDEMRDVGLGAMRCWGDEVLGR